MMMHTGVNFNLIRKEQRNKQGKTIEQNTIKKLAYNHGEKYELNNETFNYTTKQNDDFAYSILLLPNGVETNETSLELFKRLEEKEHFARGESVLARNYIFTLPNELSFEESELVVREVMGEILNRESTFCDISFHNKITNKEGERNENKHCHILECFRTLKSNGEFGNYIDYNNIYNRYIYYKTNHNYTLVKIAEIISDDLGINLTFKHLHTIVTKVKRELEQQQSQ